MKKLAMLASAALLALSLFVGCSNTSSSGNGNGGDSGTGAPAAYAEVWTGSTAITWGDGVVLEGNKFDASVKGIRLTYTGTGIAFKVAINDPWKEVKTTANVGKVADDGAVNPPDASEAATIELTFDAADVAGICSTGIKIFGDKMTVTKVETIK